MTLEDYEKASDIYDAIEYVKRLRRKIQNDEVFKKGAIDRESVLTAARDAMLAVIDEEIDDLTKQLKDL